METVKLNGLEWMTENLTGHGGTEINGNWYYTWKEAIKAVEEIGNGWRLPTAEEFEALCDIESRWDNALKGRWFGENKELFLPALGCVSNLYTISNVEGYYWSSSLYSRCVHAYILYFHSDGTLDGDAMDITFSSPLRLVRDIKNENNPQKVYALFEGYGSGKFEPLIGVFSTYEKAEEAKTFLDETKNCSHFITETKIDETFLK